MKYGCSNQKSLNVLSIKNIEILKPNFTSISFQLLRRAQKPMHQLKTRKIKLILPKKRLRRLLRRLLRQMNLKQNLVPNLLQTLRHQSKNRPKFYLVLFTKIWAKSFVINDRKSQRILITEKFRNLTFFPASCSNALFLLKIDLAFFL